MGPAPSLQLVAVLDGQPAPRAERREGEPKVKSESPPCLVTSWSNHSALLALSFLIRKMICLQQLTYFVKKTRLRRGWICTSGRAGRAWRRVQRERRAPESHQRQTLLAGRV